jgi:hypothetical protein
MTISLRFDDTLRCPAARLPSGLLQQGVRAGWCSRPGHGVVALLAFPVRRAARPRCPVLRDRGDVCHHTIRMVRSAAAAPRKWLALESARCADRGGACRGGVCHGIGRVRAVRQHRRTADMGAAEFPVPDCAAAARRLRVAVSGTDRDPDHVVAVQVRHHAAHADLSRFPDRRSRHVLVPAFDLPATENAACDLRGWSRFRYCGSSGVRTRSVSAARVSTGLARFHASRRSRGCR